MDDDCNLITWPEARRTAVTMAQKVCGKDWWIPDVILGILRGGRVPAEIAREYLHKEFPGRDIGIRYVVTSKYYEDGKTRRADGSVAIRCDDAGATVAALAEGLAGKRVLVADDILDTGDTIRKVLDACCRMAKETRIGVMYAREYRADFEGCVMATGDIRDGWLTFPWETARGD